MKLTYAYAYIKLPLLKNVKLSLDNSKLIDVTTNSIIMDLINIPNNNLLYKVNLEIIESKTNNIKIIVEIDDNLLENLVSTNKYIPNNKQLFLLLKRNYILNYNNVHYDSINMNYKKVSFKSNKIYKKGFLKFNNLIIDFNSDKIYIENKIKESEYLFDISVSILYSYPNINLFKKIIKSLKLNKTLLLYNYENLNLLQKYFTKTNIEIVNINIALKDKLSNTNYNTIILFDLSNNISDLKIIKNFLQDKKLIIINHKNRHISRSDYFNLLIDNKCLDNINIFNKCILNIENNSNLVFSHKNFNKYNSIFNGNYNKIINKLINNIYNNLSLKDKNLYNSIPENILNFDNNNILNTNYIKQKLKNNDACAICLSKLKKKKLIITNCGHIYCECCILTNLINSNKCPECRDIIKLNNLYKYDYTYSNKLNYIYNTYNNIYNIYNNTCNNSNTKLKISAKILVVSYYQESLKTIYDILKNKYIKCTIIKKKEDESYNLYLINIKNITCIHDFNDYKKIIVLENDYKDFDYYKYLLCNNSKTKIDILDHYDNTVTII